MNLSDMPVFSIVGIGCLQKPIGSVFFMFTVDIHT